MYINLDDILINEFEETNLCDYILRLHNKAQDFLRNSQMPPTVYLNSTIYAFCCRNVISELAKFRNLPIFTSDDNTILNAYTAAWRIRHKPFQHKENCAETLLYVNESFATPQSLKLFLRALNF